jgi:ribosomal protein S24E
MEIRITRDAYNPLLRRKEVSFFVDHVSSFTPKLYDVRKAIAVKFGVQEEIVFVKNLETLTGTTRAVGKAEVYDSEEDAKTLVPNYMVSRNMVDRHKSKEAAPKETGKSQAKQEKQAQAKS